MEKMGRSEKMRCDNWINNKYTTRLQEAIGYYFLNLFILNKVKIKGQGLLEKYAQKIMIFECMSFSKECKRFQMLRGYGVLCRGVKI